MIHAIILVAALDGQNVAWFGDNAYYALIPFCACTHGAYFSLGEILAYLAAADVFPCFENGVCKALTLAFRK